MDERASRILYVEDQPEMVELVRLTLRRLGCDVYGVGDGCQALQIMRDLRPDLVLLDLMLPGWDGWQVSKAMQADEELRELPVILVTARVASVATDRQPPPAEAYITKPFSLAEIRATVQHVLSNHKPLARAA